MPMILIGLTVVALLSALAGGVWPWGQQAALILLCVILLLMLFGVKG